MSRAFDLLRAARDLRMPAPPPKLSPTDKLVLLALVMRADPDGVSWPSHNRLAADTWLSRRAVQDSIARLRQVGILDVQVRKREGSREHDTSVYRVRIEVVQQAHHVVQEAHYPGSAAGALPSAAGSPGSAPAARQVVQEVHQGSAPAAHKVPTEVPVGSAQGSLLPLSGPPEPAPNGSKSRKPPKHSPDEIAAKEQIVVAFVEAFKTAKAIDPNLENKGDHAAAFALAKAYGAEEGCAIVRRAMRDPWVLEHAPTLRHVASKPDAWRGAVPKTNGIKVQPSAPTRAFAIGRSPAVTGQGGGE
jgi:hypothetical protein